MSLLHEEGRGDSQMKEVQKRREEIVQKSDTQEWQNTERRFYKVNKKGQHMKE